LYKVFHSKKEDAQWLAAKEPDEGEMSQRIGWMNE
jgi:hypothetical protein